MTSNDPNPYSAPKESAFPQNGPPPVPGTQPFYFRDGKFLVIRDGAALPDVCVRSNEAIPPGEGWKKQMPVVWTPPWVAILFLAGGPLLYAIVALATQKKAKVTYSFSAATRKRVVRLRLVGLALLLAAVAMVALGASVVDPNYVPYLIIGGIIVLIASVIPFTMANPIKVGGFDNGWFKLKGASPEFLDSLPGPHGPF